MQIQHKTAKERMQEIRMLYLRQQLAKAEAQLTSCYHQHTHLQVAAFTHLIQPEDVPCPGEAGAELINRMSGDVDYVVAYNAIREGYHPSAVADQINSWMCDREYSQSPQYPSQVVDRAISALNKEHHLDQALAVG